MSDWGRTTRYKWNKQPYLLPPAYLRIRRTYAFVRSDLVQVAALHLPRLLPSALFLKR
ncbi:hypothetical protein [Chlorogloeopsis sp. ULAP02]|uniref:hypothetical protein n=1 Tax=Chlorogloeopsis sp. ULAP02 TaxID=3107926 RepID=UPI003134AC4F